MDVCAQCGYELGIGRFCVNCGHPVGEPADPAYGRTDTAERPAVVAPASTPPPPPPPPEPVARYPLFADEVAADPESPRRTGRRRRAWWPWLVGAAVMVLVAALGLSLMFGDDDEPVSTASETRTNAPEASPSEPESPTTEPAEPKTPKKPAKPDKPTDLAPGASASVPRTAPPSTDYDGNQVRYDARRMLDGVPTTCWRMGGDATGRSIVITLAEESTLTSVALVNGYAKTATDNAGNELDWYAGNRRVLAVEWSFDDGTSVTQDLGETRDLQRLDLDQVTTSTITLTLVDVSDPGTGPSRRDYTAISEISAVGSPA